MYGNMIRLCQMITAVFDVQVSDVARSLGGGVAPGSHDLNTEQ